jgi:heme O synthase-like polyprenyltransferase
MIANAALGYWTGFSGGIATAVLVLINAYFGYRCWQLFRECSQGAARQQMFASFLHLPLSLIVLLLDNI